MKCLARYTIVIFTFLFFFSGKPIPDGIVYQFEIINNKKEIYQLGETLVVKINAIQNTRACTNGVEKTRIFTKGLTLVSQTQWTKLESNTYEKNVTVTVKGNKKNDARITAFRQTDRGVIAESFPILYMKE